MLIFNSITSYANNILKKEKRKRKKLSINNSRKTYHGISKWEKSFREKYD